MYSTLRLAPGHRQSWHRWYFGLSAEGAGCWVLIVVGLFWHQRARTGSLSGVCASSWGRGAVLALVGCVSHVVDPWDVLVSLRFSASPSVSAFAKKPLLLETKKAELWSLCCDFCDGFFDSEGCSVQVKRCRLCCHFPQMEGCCRSRCFVLCCGFSYRMW